MDLFPRFSSLCPYKNCMRVIIMNQKQFIILVIHILKKWWSELEHVRVWISSSLFLMLALFEVRLLRRKLMFGRFDVRFCKEFIRCVQPNFYKHCSKFVHFWKVRKIWVRPNASSKNWQNNFSIWEIVR